MADSDDTTSNKSVESPPMAPPADVGNQSSAFEVSSIIWRWRREDLLNRGYLALRVLALLFSFLSFIIMASNMHGGPKNFNKYEEYRYCLAIAILSTLYTGGQALRQFHELSTEKVLFSQRTSSLINFLGDQIMAYLLISAASAAIPLTNWMREGSDNMFTDSSAASICMAFLAFITLALSALISGFKISNKTYT